MVLSSIRVSLSALSVALCTISAGAQPVGPCVQPPPEAIAWWPLDETSGVSVHDRVGGLDGTLTNGAMPDEGKVRGGVRFDGVNDYIIVPDDDRWAFGTRDFTIELWAMLNAPGGSVGHPGDIFIGNDEGPGTRRKWFFALGGGVLNFHVNGSTGAGFFPQVPFAPAPNQWYHLALVRRGDRFTIFVDGVARGSTTRNVVVPNAAAPLTIGQAENLGFVNGRLDEITVYDRALADEEVQAIFHADHAGKCIGISVYPERGGNAGTVSMRLTGAGFEPGATVALTNGVQGLGTSVHHHGTTILTSFELEGTVPSVVGVTVVNPSGSTIHQPDVFEIIAGGEPRLRTEIVGMNLIRAGGEQTLWLTSRNEGEIDAWAAFAVLEVPPNLEYQIGPSETFVSAPTTTAIPILYSRLGTDQAEAVPFRIRAPIGGDTITLRSDISVGLNGVLGLENRYEPYFEEEDLGRTVEGRRDQAGVSGRRGARPPGAPPLIAAPGDVVGPGQPGGTGYIHYYRLTGPGIDPKGEQQVGIITGDGSGGWKIGWSLAPDVGVEERQFGQTITFGDPPNVYTAEHMFGIDPGLPTDMMAQRFANLVGQPYCNPSRQGCPSCIGLVLRVAYGEDKASWPEKFWVPCGLSPRCPCDRPGQKCVDTDRFLTKLLEILGVDGRTFAAELRGAGLEGDALAWVMQIIGSWDPNEKAGPQGAGAERFVAAGTAMNYTILFENLESATAAAQEVVVRDSLDVNLDLATASLGPITFGPHTVVPSGGPGLLTEYDLRPENDLIVRITVTLDPGSRVLTWRLSSIDPDTGQPPTDPLAGFLPPNVNPPEGEGAVLFSVTPTPGLGTGTPIRNQAEIFFDFNPPILTQEWVNTIDAQPPVSQVSPLAAIQTTNRFRVEWSGSDAASGVRNYDVWVSDDGAPYHRWLAGVVEQSAAFTGSGGHEYSFYSVARDWGGNVEGAPLGPDAITLINQTTNAAVVDLVRGREPDWLYPRDCAADGETVRSVLFGGGDLDPAEIEPGSVLWDGVSPTSTYLEDVGRNAADGTPDGLKDLVLEFSFPELCVAFGGLVAGDTVTTRLAWIAQGEPAAIVRDLPILADESVGTSEFVVHVLPVSLALSNSPNPFRGSTDLILALPEPGPVKLIICDAGGRLVDTLVHGSVEAGVHTFRWGGHSVASGVYFARLETSEKVLTRKLLLLK